MDRKYQIFISSTYVDLAKERDTVTKQILEEHHFPIGMEMFIPNDKKQWKTIKETIDSSDLYFLILGFRYGSLDPESGLSYTEKEYDYALKRGIPIIAFVRNDDMQQEHERLKRTPLEERINPTTFNDRLDEFYTTKYDKNQDNILNFRNRILPNKLSGIFSDEKPIDVKSVIHNKIKEIPNGGWIKQKYLLQSKFFILLSSLLFFVTIVLIVRENITIRSRLKTDEAELFEFANDSSLEFARTIPDYSTLLLETSISKTVKKTTDSFYFISNAGKVLHELQPDIDSCVKYGAHFKILLIDTASEKIDSINHGLIYNPNLKDYSINYDNMIKDFNKTINLMSIISKNVIEKKYLGKIELRLYRGPSFFQLWIKDPNKKNGIIHMSTIDYTGFKPNFRISKNSSPKLFKLYVEYFNNKWDTSINTKKVF